MRQASVREYAAAVRSRYQRGSKAERGRMLDEFCRVTGYHRVYARALLREQPGRATLPSPVSARRGRPPRYGEAEVRLLQACWEVTDGVCGKRLAPFLSELLERLAACDALPTEATPDVISRVAGMSPATVDRCLAAYRARWPGKGRGVTKPGTLLKSQIPIRTFADWDEGRPGFLEIDLVAHCGASGAGEFLFTLSAVDVLTGWMALEPILNKGELAVFEAIGRLRARLPFPLLGLDSDNGSEFINHALVRWCGNEGITVTRSRPYRKNDNCYIEQKNWSVVRRLVGYARFERDCYVPLRAVYDQAETQVNFLQPVLKLREKVRDGAKITKRYETARTPYRRLLDSACLNEAGQSALRTRFETLHPVQLKLDIEQAQQALYHRARREGSVMSQRIDLEKIYL